jgi:hypothetical protein
MANMPGGEAIPTPGVVMIDNIVKSIDVALVVLVPLLVLILVTYVAVATAVVAADDGLPNRAEEVGTDAP